MQLDNAATAEQIRELDRRAIEEYGIPRAVLMENAGRCVADEVLDMLADPLDSSVIILCGKGNNGGDGFVVARHLDNAGVAVEIVTAAPLEALDCEGEAAANFRVVRKIGIEMRQVLTEEEAKAESSRLKSTELIVDALLGTGLQGEVREPARSLILTANESGTPIVAVDTPSGLCCDTGKVLGVAIRASLTVTLAAPKKGFTIGEGPDHTGELVLADIGIPRGLLAEMGL